MLTTTGRAIIIVGGALIGLGIGAVVGVITPLSFTEGIGAAAGAGLTYVVTRFWI